MCSFLRHIPSVPNFLTKLVAKEAEGVSGAAVAAASQGKAPYEVDEEEAGQEGATQGLRGSADDSSGEESREPSGFFRAFRAPNHAQTRGGGSGSSRAVDGQAAGAAAAVAVTMLPGGGVAQQPPREQASIPAAGGHNSSGLTAVGHDSSAADSGLQFGSISTGGSQQQQQQPGSRGLY